MKKILQCVANLLVVMENDIGSTFLLLENCLREPENPLLAGHELRVGGATYSKIILTPLMMDFGYKGNRPAGEGRIRRFHYDMRAGKPIVEQVVDVFRAIRTYVETESTTALEKKFPALGTDTQRVFEIYPFLGLNPANYTLESLTKLTNKYFDTYTGQRADLLGQLGRFDGNIEHLGPHAFAGIKVYPPLGFDPWPANDRDAMAKIEHLYGICSDKGIPITVHGGAGGFVVVDAKRLHEITATSKWASALKAYPDLKIDLAHFPMGKMEAARRHDTLALVLDYENVYVDISCRATSESYYQRLKDLFDALPVIDLDTLQRRILFGTDFAVNLMWIDSYNRYVDLYSRTPSLTPQEKHAFCSVNPASFVFHNASALARNEAATYHPNR